MRTSEPLDFSLALFFHIVNLESELTRVNDTSDGADLGHVAQPQLFEVPVLSWLEVQHLAPEVGLLEHQPVAVHHVAGLAVGHTEAIHHVVAVFHQLVHLASEVLLLIDPHAEGSPVLWMKTNRGNYWGFWYEPKMKSQLHL